MTGSFSIFLKVCPACAAQVPTASAQCKCGHDFESSAPSDLPPEELALRDEELYENYLVARAEQAQQAARAAQDACMDDPEDNDKAAEAELAREVAKSIESDLAEQRTKIGALRRAVEAKRPKPAPPVSIPVVVTEATPPLAAEPSAPPTVVVTPPEPVPAPKNTEEDATVTVARVHAIAVPTESKPAATTASPVLTSPAASARKAANVLGAIKQAKAREAAAQSRKAHKAASKPVPAPAPAQPPAPPAEIASVPPPGFRQEQAARAEQVMETRKFADYKDCPNCTSSVPIATTRCSCGFAFITGGNDLPSLTLCTGDFTALRNSLNLHLRRR